MKIVQSYTPEKAKEVEAEIESETTQKTATDNKKTSNKKSIILLILGLVFLIAGISCLLFVFLAPKEVADEFSFPTIPSQTESIQKEYSVLTGEELSDPNQKNAPIYCIQTPNGTDGARPQTGLTEAGVVFEAVAEAGITRFAAIYQNPKNAIIGPIRSLRTYYLDWDTPFDCTIVHAGGAPDAVARVSSGKYKDLTENYSYMYRGEYGYHQWNNLFTTPALLNQNSIDYNRTSSNATGFARLTPEESKQDYINNVYGEDFDITGQTEQNTKEVIGSINLSFNSGPSFNVHYDYNPSTNKYARSYEYDGAHVVYTCPDQDLYDKDPTDYCEKTQLTPSVVIAMIVNEKRAADGAHEDITTIGSNTAYIFQNGTAIKGTWRKDSVDSQIKFFNENGEEIRLATGQTWISAIPTYGSVDY